jgi:hypothetical protein
MIARRMTCVVEAALCAQLLEVVAEDYVGQDSDELVALSLAPTGWSSAR